MSVRPNVANRAESASRVSSRLPFPPCRDSLARKCETLSREWAETVLDKISIALQACDPAANRHRSWRVEAGRDLFGRWCARDCFGRIGCRGRTVWHEFGSEAEACAFLRRSLRRGRGSIQRCGVAYRLIEASPAAAPLLAVTGIAASRVGLTAESNRNLRQTQSMKAF